jgi:hypothetical protein
MDSFKIKGQKSFTFNQLLLQFVLRQTRCPTLNWLLETFRSMPSVAHRGSSHKTSSPSVKPAFPPPSVTSTSKCDTVVQTSLQI